MAREAFPRTPSGLVDLACYKPFLVDPPERVPTRLPHGYTEVLLNWKYQHVIFMNNEWRQQGVLYEDKNRDRADFRCHPYNQLVMRPRKEWKAHLKFQEHIELDSISDHTIAGFLEDSRHIDLVGAARLGQQLAAQPKKLEDISSDPGQSAAWNELSPTEIGEFFEGVERASLGVLADTVISDHVLIASALKRTARQLSDPGLDSTAEELFRSLGDRYIYPVKVRKISTFYNLGNGILSSAFGIGATQAEREGHEESVQELAGSSVEELEDAEAA